MHLSAYIQLVFGSSFKKYLLITYYHQYSHRYFAEYIRMIHKIF